MDSEKLKRGRFARLALVGLAGLLAVPLAIWLLGFWALDSLGGSRELLGEDARRYIAPEDGDKILHAYLGHGFDEKLKYFVIKVDPAEFESRIKKLSAPDHVGKSSEWETRVSSGPGKSLWYRSEPLPSWWDVDALDSAIAVDVTLKGGGPWTKSIFSKERGLIYIVRQ